MEYQDPIISYLRQNKILDEQTLSLLAEEHHQSGQSVIGLIKAKDLLDELSLSRAVAQAHQIEFINLSPDMVDPMVAHLITYELASRHTVIPVRKDGNQLVVAMANPLNLAVRDQLEMKTGFHVVAAAAVPSVIRQTIHFHFNVENITRQTIVSMRLKNETETPQDEYADLQESITAESDPITRLVSSIISGAIDSKASDIHIEPQNEDVRVRYRVDGILRKAVNFPATAQTEVVAHIKILADMDISEHRTPQDGHIQRRYDGREYDLRVSSLPGIGGEKIVIRILEKSSSQWSLDTVVSDARDNQHMRRLIANPYGMILVTGPTGSGKTTTLYSLLQLLNRPEVNIVTVEDPVEYRLEGITQLQVKPAAGLTFASALRSIVRQDPDIILVGEIRDIETAEIAVSAALTGHLVLSTLHTNDAAGAIYRLINLSVPPYLVASALLGTVAQRLVRTVCPECRQSYRPDPKHLSQLSLPADLAEQTLYKADECQVCGHTGYRGRQSVYEILTVSPKIRRMIVENQNSVALKEQATAEGMRTLYQSALDRVKSGQTTIDEMIRVVEVEGI